MSGFEGGSRFPFINLQKAIARAEELYKADHRGNEMPISGAFGVWGYSEKSSGGFQTIAALKMYGLLEDAGSKESRKVKLTKHALDYFRDERPAEREQKLQDFATNPKLFMTLFNRYWGAHVPDDAIARSQLKIEGELNEQSSRTALGIYKENIAFAKIKGNASISEIEQGAEEEEVDDAPSFQPKVGDYIQWTSRGVDQFDAPRPVSWVSDDGKHLRVVGSMTGIPSNEVSPHDPPKLPTGVVATAPPQPAPSSDKKAPDMSVLLVGNRLQITADVDAVGLSKLQEVLSKYSEILKLLN
jgi:hypothetical protein